VVVRQRERTKRRKGKNVTRTLIAKTAISLLLVALVAGCAGLGKGPTDEELILGQLEALGAALIAQEAEKVAPLLSEDFYHPEVGDKSVITELMQQGIDMGYMDDGEFDLAGTEITVEGDTATAYPVEASSSAGSVTVEITLKKEKDGWLITGGDAEGI